MDKIKISVCFCQIPEEKLIQFVRMRFIEKTPTLELMKQMESAKDREYLATIALLDVKEEDILRSVEATDPSIMTHLLSCRQAAKKVLEGYGIRRLDGKNHDQL